MLGERRERLPVEQSDDAVAIELGAGLEPATLLFVFFRSLPTSGTRNTHDATSLPFRS
jgi:hypothetical protein